MRKMSWLALAAASLAAVSLAGGHRAWARGGDDGGGDDHGGDGGGTQQEIRGTLTVDAAAHSVAVNGTILSVTDGTRFEVGERDTTLAGLASFVAQHPG